MYIPYTKSIPIHASCFCSASPLDSLSGQNSREGPARQASCQRRARPANTRAPPRIAGPMVTQLPSIPGPEVTTGIASRPEVSAGGASSGQRWSRGTVVVTYVPSLAASARAGLRSLLLCSPLRGLDLSRSPSQLLNLKFFLPTRSPILVLT